MTIGSKEELHNINADSKDEKYVYDQDILNMLRERSREYLSGKVKTYTVEESMERIKNHRL
jgi:hypothetical protein